MDVQAIWLSLQLASFTTLILLLVGLPLAYWLAETRWRLKFLLEAAVALPIILPPTVLGFYILIAIGPQSPLGQTYETLVGRPLPFSFEGLLLASIIYSFPFAVRPFVAAFSGIDRRLVAASWCLGAAFLAWDPHRARPRLRPHARGIWRRPYGRRQYSGGYAHHFDRHLR